MVLPRALPSFIRSWFWASRPFSLQASVVTVLVGTSLAAGGVDLNWLLFALALTGSVLIQVATNLTDEYSDHRRTDSAAKFLAPHKVIQRGLLSERAVLLGLLVTFGLGIGMGLYITWQVGWPILAVGLAGVLVAYLYSSGPYPLGDLGLGEVAVFAFMGPVMVMAAYYVQAQEVTWAAFFVSLPLAFLVTAILHCNNLRDIDEDKLQGKRTIASLAGIGPSRWMYAGMLAAAYTTLVVLVLSGAVHILALAGLSSVPGAILNSARLWRADDRIALNQVMVSTSKVHGLTGMAMAVGLALGAWT
jgi:1,4-dihydroxy-2-naphthoate octaprenyltransferase